MICVWISDESFDKREEVGGGRLEEEDVGCFCCFYVVFYC